MKNCHSLRFIKEPRAKGNSFMDFIERKMCVYVNRNDILPILWHFSACLSFNLSCNKKVKYAAHF